MNNVTYLGIDVHARNCVLGKMDSSGHFKGNVSFATSEKNIIKAFSAIKEKNTYLAIEESTLARWVAQLVTPLVSKVLVCDPRENALIYKSSTKKDKIDTKKLCKLLRLGALKMVYQPQTDERAIFKSAAKHYIDLRNQQVSIKSKIKAKYRYWGIMAVDTKTVYSIKGRDQFLNLIIHSEVKNQLINLYDLMDHTVATQKKALIDLKQQGRKYPEIIEFMEIRGIGDVGAHVFDAYIQTPDRFSTVRKVWKYSQLSITEHTSDGKRLGYKRLDKSGNSELKALSYRAWMSSMAGDNEVKQYYLKSLERTHNRTHARLNTQRKIISVMWHLWKKGEAYRPELFLGSDNITA